MAVAIEQSHAHKGAPRTRSSGNAAARADEASPPEDLQNMVKSH
jgi:hypothetical protein